LPERRVVSVNVGRPREGTWGRETFTTAIVKEPVAGNRRIEGVNIVGDDQADRTVHGGPSKAVYAYSMEDYAWWSQRLERDLPDLRQKRRHPFSPVVHPDGAVDSRL